MGKRHNVLDQEVNGPTETSKGRHRCVKSTHNNNLW